MEKLRVDILFDFLNSANKLLDIEVLKKEIIEEGIYNIFSEQRTFLWEKYLNNENFEYLIMDSFCELAEQRYIHKEDQWSFACYYNQLKHEKDFKESFTYNGLLDLKVVEQNYATFCKWFFNKFPLKKIVFINFSSKFEQREEFKERAKYIEIVTQKLSKEYNNFYSVALDESKVEQNEDNQIYHFSATTKELYFQKVKEALND